MSALLKAAGAVIKERGTGPVTVAAVIGVTVILFGALAAALGALTLWAIRALLGPAVPLTWQTALAAGILLAIAKDVFGGRKP